MTYLEQLHRTLAVNVKDDVRDSAWRRLCDDIKKVLPAGVELGSVAGGSILRTSAPPNLRGVIISAVVERVDLIKLAEELGVEVPEGLR